MKNFITLALVIGFSAFAITACGDKDDDSSNTEAEEVQEEEVLEVQEDEDPVIGFIAVSNLYLLLLLGDNLSSHLLYL